MYSSVAIEALAYGCEVIIPVLPNSLMTSPAEGFEKYCHTVTSAWELRSVVDKIIDDKNDIVNIAIKKEYVRKYWCLDEELSRWKKLLLDGKSH